MSEDGVGMPMFTRLWTPDFKCNSNSNSSSDSNSDSNSNPDPDPDPDQSFPEVAQLESCVLECDYVSSVG